MEPVILALREQYEHEVSFIIVDVDDPNGKKLLEVFGVNYIPAFFYINQYGDIVAQDSGSRSFEQLESRIQVELLDQ